MTNTDERCAELARKGLLLAGVANSYHEIKLARSIGRKQMNLVCKLFHAHAAETAMYADRIIALRTAEQAAP